MSSISATAADTSCFIQGEPSPHQSVQELTNWLSSEIHTFLSTNNVRAPIKFPTKVGNSKDPEPTHASDHRDHAEEITTLTTAIIPFAGRAVPTRVILSLVPLHLGTGQYPPLNSSSPPSLDQGGELTPIPPSHPSHLSVYPITRSGTTICPRELEYAQTRTPGGFPIAPRNSIPRPKVRYDYQLLGHGDPIQEPTPDGPTAALTTSPGVAVYPPPFNQTPAPYLVSGQPLSSSLVNSDVIPPARTSYQKEGNGQCISREPGQTCQGTPTFSNTTEPIRCVGIERYREPSRYQCTMCDASYVRLSGLNRHRKDKHTAWMACRYCNSEFSLGRMHKFTEHLQTCPGA